MLKKKLNIADYVAIAANLVPLFGVFLWGWHPVQVFMIYALETVIVGLFTILKMIVTSSAQVPGDWYNAGQKTKQPAIVFILFFILHYGLFVLIQTGMVISVSGIGNKFNIGFFDFLFNWPKYIGDDAWYILISLGISYTFQFFWNFIRTNEYRETPVFVLMFQPYGRIFVQQLAVVFGAIFLSFGAGKIFLVIFVIVKIIIEVLINYDGIFRKAANELQKKNSDQKGS